MGTSLALTALVLAAPAYPDQRDLLTVRDAAGELRPVRTLAEWRLRREHILANLQEVMGPLPAEERRIPLEVEILAEEVLDTVVRRTITYAAEPDDRVPAYLFVPRDLRGQTAAVLCLHQTIAIGKGEPAGLGGSPDLHYALELAQRGYVTLAPDYPGYGDYQVDPYALGYASATMKGIWNHLRAVDLLQSLPEVDPRRVGCIGHSLGGHNTLFLAAFDERVRVAVTSCGFNAFPKYHGGDLTGWSHAGYMPRIASVYGKDPSRMPFDFPEVIAAIAPRAVFVNAPLHDANFEVSGVDDCIVAARPVYRFVDAEGALIVAHPEAGHSFPPEVREAAYEAIDRVLREVAPDDRAP